MIALLCGIPSEPPLALVAIELSRMDVPYRWVDQRTAHRSSLKVDLAGGRMGGTLADGEGEFALDSIGGAYVRLMDDRLLPGIEREPPGSHRRERSRSFHEQLSLWLDLTPAVIINRARAQASNAAKPYQMQLISASGFRVPATLITSDPEAVLEFRTRHRRVIYKSMSGARSVVTLLTDLDLQRLERIRWCPVQFQEYIDGFDVRVHTIAGAVFAAKVSSWATDYRYGARSGAPPALIEPYRLDDDLAARCLALASGLGLELAGIDLRITPEGEAVCFEVNPSPAFSYYELQAGLPIAAAIARRLASA